MFAYGAKRSVLAALAAATLVGCGGDVAGGLAPSPQTSPDLQVAMAALVRSGLSAGVTLSGTTVANGTSTPVTGSGTFTLSPGAVGTFNRAPALLQTQHLAGTLMTDGQSLPYTATVINAYDTMTSALLGQMQNAEFDVAQAPITFPMAVGTASTPLGTMSRYSDDTLSVVLGTIEVSVSLLESVVATPGEQIVQFTYKTYDTNHTLVQTDNITYGLSANSTLRFSSAITENASGTISASVQ